MRHILTLKWCVLTGALMLASVYVSLQHSQMLQDPPGVHTRWWDGTVESREIFYPDGKLQMRTTFGEDGTTVLTLQEYNRKGVVYHEKTRREDGKVYEKVLGENLKVRTETLWSPDESYYIAQREYYPNGKIMTDALMTEDGTAPVYVRQYDEHDQLVIEEKILSNADHTIDQYNNGQIVRRQNLKANGDSVVEIFFDGTTVVSQRQSVARLDGRRTGEYMNRAGEVVFSNSNLGPSTVKIRYVGGKMVLRQTMDDFDITTLEQFDATTGNITRRIDLDREKVIAVSLYRADGTLSRVKRMKDGVVVRQLDYDATGKTVVGESPTGTVETFDSRWLAPLTAPKEE